VSHAHRGSHARKIVLTNAAFSRTFPALRPNDGLSMYPPEVRCAAASYRAENQMPRSILSGWLEAGAIDQQRQQAADVLNAPASIPQFEAERGRPVAFEAV
jgi:hypothetical protein